MKISISISIFILLSLISFSSADLQEKFIQCLDNQKLPNASSIVYSPENPSFKTVLTSYIRNLRFDRPTTPKPEFIITPHLETHVESIIVCLKTLGNIQLKIRSGGHDYEGISYVSHVPFVLLDMFNLRSITVDGDSKTAWVQAGATLGELYYKIGTEYGLGFPAGVCPTVGVGGHISGGGYGNMMRKYGLSIDNVIDARIVDVNGKILNRETMGEDLFWAIRGGGGASFGVVTAFKLNLVEVPAVVTNFQLDRTVEENASELVYKWQNTIESIDNNLFIRLLIKRAQSNESENYTVKVTFFAQYLGDSNSLLTLMNTQFPELGVKKTDCQELSWIQSLLNWHDLDIKSPKLLLSRELPTQIYLKRKSDYVKTPISIHGLNSIWKNMTEGDIMLVFNPYGGKMHEINETATAFPHRAGNLFKIQYAVNWEDAELNMDKMYLDQSRRLYKFMKPFVSKKPRSSYLNYRDLDIGVNSFGKNSYKEGKKYGKKYFGVNFDRLVKIKTAVDPTNFFRNEQSIPVLNLVQET
ncbi:berberine bridge enzyme-like 8 [Impatiens glandulifera]|uniref:berberine bridge enzyme-like 8 n=1 Tax=Impatiens glandulifera TaxID=253017 RepID=UPI001FB19283|nr:berberine bridge enzyme-like 8 [Impatiens glandulifera]